MNNDDETTVTQLQSILWCNGNSISLASIRRCRAALGWTYHGSRYCQMIRAPNKDKRLQFAQDCIQRGDDFDDVIWSDETSIQLECHRRHCFRKKNQPLRLKPKPKHPIKVHVWGAISKHGVTEVYIFEEKMDTASYIQILQSNLVPFISSHFSSGHCFMQDNDPKHTSRKAKDFFCSTIHQLVENPSRISGYESDWKFMARIKGIHTKRSETQNQTTISEWHTTILEYGRCWEMHTLHTQLAIGLIQWDYQGFF